MCTFVGRYEDVSQCITTYTSVDKTGEREAIAGGKVSSVMAPRPRLQNYYKSPFRL